MDELILLIDIQNDFLDGALGVCKTKEEKEEYINKVATYLERRKKYIGTRVAATLDTHETEEKYRKTQEGVKTPVHHCAYGSDGRKMPDKLKDLTTLTVSKFKLTLSLEEVLDILNKRYISGPEYDRIEIFGIATDICVISNAFAIKQVVPEIPVVIIEDLCLGTSEEAHQRAIEVLRGCQFEIEKSGV